MYYGDIAISGLLYVPFYTHQADGTPITLAGTPDVVVYKDDDDTQSSDGITLSVDDDGRTGFHRIKVDASDVFYEGGHDYILVLASGTVDSVSVVGYVLGSFSIQNRYMRGTDNVITLDETGIRSAIGLNSANLDTQLTNLPTDIDDYLSGIHGSGNWETSDLTASDIDTLLSSSHGAGSWVNTENPTVAQIDDYLSGIHGSGSWETSTLSVSDIDTELTSNHGAGSWQTNILSANDIDTLLSTNHGSGIWEDSGLLTVEQIDDYLSGVHGSGDWSDISDLTAQDVEDLLTQNHGSGSWVNTENPTIIEIDDYLSGIHGSGNWEGGGSLAAQDIEDLLSLNHGSGLWTDSGSQGTNIVNIYTENQDGDIVGGVTIEVRPSGSAELIGKIITSESTGLSLFNLDDGQYEIFAYKTGLVSFINPYYIDVDGTENVTLTGTQFAIPVPDSGDLVRVYAYVDDLGLNAIENVELIIKPSGNGLVNNNFLFVQNAMNAFSDSDGYVYLDIGASLPVKVNVPKAKYEQYILLPASGSIDLSDYL